MAASVAAAIASSSSLSTLTRRLASASVSPLQSLKPCICRARYRAAASRTHVQRRHAGTFKVDNNLHTYHERKILPYNQRQLYALIADVENYSRFIPLVSSSRVMRHRGRGNADERPWLDDQGEPNEVHEFDATLKIKAMGFDEAWKSHVTCEKYSEVSARADPSSLFKVLRTTWTLTPTPPDAPHPSTTPPPRSGNPLSSPGRPFSTSSPSAASLRSEAASAVESKDSSTAASLEADSDSAANLPTMVSFDLAYEFANPFYQMAAGQAFQTVSGKIMGAFEKRVREVYGEGSA